MGFKISETKEKENSEKLVKLAKLPYTKIDPNVFPAWTIREESSTSQSSSPTSNVTSDGNGKDNDPDIITTAADPPQITSEPGFGDDCDNITGRDTDLLDWSISLSNRFYQDDKQKIYLAISCILFRDMIKHLDQDEENEYEFTKKNRWLMIMMMVTN